jgi:apolipoprotein N-acyltransferase
MAPFHIWPVLFFTFTGLIWLLDGAAAEKRTVKRMRRGAAIGFAFGFGYFLFGIYWVGYAFLVDADRYALAIPFAIMGLSAGLALYYAAACALALLMWRRGYARIAAFVFAMFLAEVARGFLLTGFPWNLFGYALTASDAFMQAASLVGVYGLTLGALFVFSAPAALLAARQALAVQGKALVAPLVLGLCLLAGLYGFGHWRLNAALEADGTGVQLRIVQPNIAQSEKWKPENRRWIFDRHLNLSRHGVSGADIAQFDYVIWPESSVPFLFVFNNDVTDKTAQALLAELTPPGTTLLIGAERADGYRDGEGRAHFNRVYNSLFVVDDAGALQGIYDKTHLVPFGEYVPLGSLLRAFGFDALSHRLDGFSHGGQRKLFSGQAAQPSFAPLICYEIVFPGLAISRKNRPQWIVNVTNDAWYGHSTGPYQHLHQARLRAVEEGLPVVRAANTGISAVIDAHGRLIAELPFGTTGTIDRQLPPTLPSTFYSNSKWQQLILCLIMPLLIYFIIVIKTANSAFKHRINCKYVKSFFLVRQKSDSVTPVVSLDGMQPKNYNF